jgi:hypothetical protein
MTYEQYVLDTFKEDQGAYGLCMDEIEDIIQETPFSKIEKFLSKRYNLNEMYENDCK